MMVGRWRAAVVASVAIVLVLGRRRGLPTRPLVVTTAVSVVGVWIGARLLHVVLNPSQYADLGDVLRPRFSGLALYGGLIVGGIGGVVAARSIRLPIARTADVAAVAALVGIAVARVGCFLNGCCFGHETGLPWGVTFPVGSPAWADQASSDPVATVFGGQASHVDAVHPTQLYELTAALVIAFLAYRMGRTRRPGSAFLVAAIAFSSFRWANWHLRVPAASLEVPWLWDLVYPAIVTSMLLVWWLRTEAELAVHPPTHRPDHRQLAPGSHPRPHPQAGDVPVPGS